VCHSPYCDGKATQDSVGTSLKTVNLSDRNCYFILLQVDECIQYLCSPYRLCGHSRKEVLLLGFEPTTLTNRVNALTTELQSPYFSMYSYSIKIMLLLQGIQNSTPVHTLLLCVSFFNVSNIVVATPHCNTCSVISTMVSPAPLLMQNVEAMADLRQWTMVGGCHDVDACSPEAFGFFFLFFFGLDGIFFNQNGGVFGHLVRWSDGRT
jgi:hypothetical protein